MKNLVGKIIGSVGVKIGIIMVALGGTTAAAILISTSLITSITHEVESLVEEHMPPLESAMHITTAVNGFKDATNSLIMTYSIIGFPKHKEGLTNAALELRNAAQPFSREQHPNLNASLDNLLEETNGLIAQKHSELTSSSNNFKSLSSLNRLSHDVSGELNKISKSAAFRVMIATGEAVSATQSGIDTLIDDNMGGLATLYELKSLSEYATGTAIAYVSSEGTFSRQTAKNLTLKATDDLETAIIRVEDLQGNAPILAPSKEILRHLRDLQSSNLIQSEDTLTTLLDEHSKFLRTIETILTDKTLALHDAGKSFVQKNESIVKNLTETRFAEIRAVDTLNIAVKSALLKLQQGATSINPGYVAALQFELLQDSAEIKKSLNLIAKETAEKVGQILAAADPETGLLAIHLDAINAQAASRQTASNLIADLLTLSSEVAAISQDSLEEIAKAGTVVISDARSASTTMNSIGLIAILTLIAAPFMTYFTIMRPLHIVTHSTERLADGDMSELKTTGGNHGEIARLMSALRVFRNNLLEKDQMEAEAVERTKSERLAEIAAEKLAKERDAEERERERQNAAREKELEAAAELEKENARAATEAERLARHQEQTAIVSALADGLRRLAQGDISKTIDEEFPSGYEQLRSDFNDAVKSLKDVVSKLSTTSQAIHSNSTEISHAADDLSVRTERTASTLAESAAALTQLTVSVKSAADGASLANQTVKAARTNAESTNLVVKDAISAMDAISDSSSKISKIISVIDDIAFQTNLLALNAGVEAARAGEAGRGFAVVASEVRALAQRSSEAAHEINQLISVSGVEVKRGVSLVDRTGEALKSIVGDVTKIATHMAEIETSATEQSAGISEINLAVADLDQATQQNAAMFEETTAASHSLTQEAATLTGIVAQFKTETEQAQSPSKSGSGEAVQLAS